MTRSVSGNLISMSQVSLFWISTSNRMAFSRLSLFIISSGWYCLIHASSGTMTVFTFWAKSATMMVSSYWYSNDRLAAPVATSLPLSTNIIM
ncbi:hypothetical protein D3C84_1030300 [compost metagenome]